MLLSTIQIIPGKEYEVIGMVSGASVLSRNIGRDFGAGLKNLVGGELKAYTELLDQSQVSAVQRMMEKAQNMGADAIVGIRLTTSSITQGGAEVLAYGTAVKFV